MNIQEIIAEIMEHLRGMRRYRWWGIGVAWVISIAGCFAIYAMEDVYEASAKVYVDTQSLVGPVFEGLSADRRSLVPYAHVPAHRTGAGRIRSKAP